MSAVVVSKSHFKSHTSTPRIVRSTRGRVRIHLPGLTKASARRVEQRLRKATGVRRAEASPLTGNVLIEFDPTLTSSTVLLAAADAAARRPERSRRSTRATAAPIERRRPARRRPAAVAAAVSVAESASVVLARIGRPTTLRKPALCTRCSASAAVYGVAGSLIARPLLRRFVGPTAANVLMLLPSIIGVIISLLTASTPLGLASAGIEALQLVGKMSAFRAA